MTFVIYVVCLIVLILFRRRISLIFLTCFLGFGVVLISITAMENLYSEKPVLKVFLTGKTQMREIEWKNPNGSLRYSSIECHEIVFQRIDGTELARFNLCGDLIGVRAKILHFHRFLNAIGISNQYQWDLVYTGYRHSEDYQNFPIEAYSLSKRPGTFFRGLLFKCWNTLFFNRSHSFLFKSANLQSNYFPAVDESGKVLKAEYSLTISSAGLSSTKI